MNIEEVRGAILISCAGMRRLLADLNYSDAETFYRRIHIVELEARGATTEDQIAAAKLSFGVVRDALGSTSAGDDDVILNVTRSKKYLIKEFPV